MNCKVNNNNIIKDIIKDIIKKFVQHVYEEVNTVGWKTRKNELLIRKNFRVDMPDTSSDFEDHMTFQYAMDKYEGNLDKVFSFYLVPILLSNWWVEVWVDDFIRNMSGKERIFRNCEPYFELIDVLYLQHPWVLDKEMKYEDIKDILGLNIMLK